MRKLSAVLLIVCVFFLSGNAMALSLYDITGLNGTGDYYDTGAESAILTDTDGNNDDATAFLFFEYAGFASKNTFGIYSFEKDGTSINLLDTLEVFNGPDSPTTSVTLAFDLDAGTVFNQSNNLSANIGANFGFYITTPQNYTYYSHTVWNDDGYDHMMIFDTSDNVVGNLLGSDIVIAMEDLFDGGG